MKTLRLSLVLLFAATWMNTASAQTDPPFEGLRFLSFSADGKAYIPAYISGTFSYSFSRESNAFLVVNLTKDWLPDEMVETNLVTPISGTNWWSVNPTNSVLGEIFSRAWVCKDSNGNVTASGNETTYYQDAIVPFLGKGTLTNLGLTGVAAEMELVIAGDPAFTNDVVVKFTISAVDADTGLPIPDEDITLGNGVTNGVAWAKFADNTTNSATPGITGHSNWTATVSATIYRADIWVDEIAWFGTDTNLLLAAAAAAAPGESATINAERVFSETTTNAITGTTAHTVVGKWVTLRADPEGATKYEWEIGGPTVSNFVGGATSGGPVYGMTTNSRWVSFAGWQPSTNTIKLTVTIGGMEMKRECKFKVEDPFVQITTVPGNIALDANHLEAQLVSLHFGDAGGNPGVKFTHNGSVLDGSFQWVQIVNSGVSKLKKGGNQWTMTGAGLDTRYPYSSRDETSDSPSVAGYEEDTQVAEGLDNLAYEEVEANDSFTMYLMFKPFGGVWVPVQQVDWDWNAKAVKGPTGWDFPNAPTKNVPAAMRATGWPTWNTNVKDAIWWQE